MSECLITFSSTHYALKAEKVLKEHRLQVVPMPMPREISSSCGLSLSFDCRLKESVVEALKKSKVEVEGIYFREEGGLKKTRFA
ncbi:MAG: DUF3343 domain-containing protein [bacterium]|nr:DUF3343 domain-containing protein [bacterium]